MVPGWQRFSVVVALTLAMLGCSSGPEQGGPLDLGDGDTVTTWDMPKSSFHSPVRVGFGPGIATNTGSDTVTLKGLTFTAESGSARIVEVWAVDYTEQGEYFTLDYWPDTLIPAEELNEVEGYEIHPQESTEFVVVIDIPAEGVYRWSEMTLDYTYQDREYTASVVNGLHLCAQPTAGCDL